MLAAGLAGEEWVTSTQINTTNSSFKINHDSEKIFSKAEKWNICVGKIY